MSPLSKNLLVSCLAWALSLLMFTASLSAEKKSNRMSRMPLLFGKRFAQPVQGGELQSPTSNQHWVARGNPAVLFRSANEREENKDFVEGVLSLENNLVKTVQFNRGYDAVPRTTSFSLIPTYVGKIYTNPSKQYFTANKGSNKRHTGLVLNRMPTFYGKRSTDKQSTALQYPQGFVRVQKRGVLRRMPNFYGKRSHSPTLAAYENSNEDTTFIDRYIDTHGTTLLNEVLWKAESNRESNMAAVLLRLLETSLGYRMERPDNNNDEGTKATGVNKKSNNDVSTNDVSTNDVSTNAEKPHNSDKNNIANTAEVESDYNGFPISNVDLISTYPSTIHYLSTLNRLPRALRQSEINSLLSIPETASDISITPTGNGFPFTDMPTSETSAPNRPAWIPARQSDRPSSENIFSDIANMK